MNKKAYLGLPEVAAQLGVHYNTAYRLITKGDLSAVKVGTQWRVSPDDLQRYIGRNASGPHVNHENRVFAIVNQKGGVGKSTVAVNLSEALAILGCKVLLIDFDPQGNSTTGVGINAESLPTTMAEVLLDGIPLEEAIQTTPFGFDVVPADIGLSEADIELMSRISRETFLHNAMGRASQRMDNYDFIFIDCPPSLGLLSLNALAAADSCLIPVDVGKYSLEGVKLLLKTISDVRQALNPELHVGPFVITQADFRTNLTNEFVTHLEQIIPYPVARTIIKNNVRIAEAPFEGQPIAHYDPKGEAAKMFLNLAEELLGGVNGGD